MGATAPECPSRGSPDCTDARRTDCIRALGIVEEFATLLQEWDGQRFWEEPLSEILSNAVLKTGEASPTHWTHLLPTIVLCVLEFLVDYMRLVVVPHCHRYPFVMFFRA